MAFHFLYTLRANLATAPPRPPWARRPSAVHEVVAEAALLVPFGVAGVMFLQLATGLALAILYPILSAEMELLHKRARTNAPNMPAQIVSVDDIDSDCAEWSALVSAEHGVMTEVGGYWKLTN